MKPDIHSYPTTLGLANAVCDEIVDVAHRAVTMRGRFTIALSGGNTPKVIYEMLASNDFAEQINWNYTHVFWGDERCVPPNDHDSNYRMAREFLLNRVRVPISNLHRMHGEIDPEKSAAEYDAELRDFFTKRIGSAKARFDLVLLGMGADGHTASLFPGMPAVRETERWVVAQHVEKLNSWRITLTPTAINAAANIFFVIMGEDKAPTLKRVLFDPPNPDMLPSQIVNPTDGTLKWYLDAAASKGLGF